MPECLFTKDDWKVWEKIDKRSKGRSPKFKSGKYSNKYEYGKCKFCNKKIVSYMIIKHLEQDHNNEFTTWDELSKLRDNCLEQKENEK